MSLGKDDAWRVRGRCPSPNPGQLSNSSRSNSTASGQGASVPTKRRNSRIPFLPRMVSEAVGESHHHDHHRDHHHHSLSPAVNKERYRIVLMGGSRVGKTAIVQQFLHERFPTEHLATVEELHKSEYEVRGLGTVAVEILDTSGSFPFPAMKRLAISNGHAFILAFAVDDKESFEEVIQLRELIAQTKTTDAHIPLVIAGNKSDLELPKRQVGREMAECECIDWDVAYVECSAKTGDNVVQIFQQLLLQAHLKGVLKASLAVPSPSKSSSSSNSEGRQRRRSSMPINELFTQHMPSFRSSHRPTSPGPKRNSCALS